MQRYLLGWDVGGTKCAAVVGTGDGDIVDRVEWLSASTRGPSAMIEAFRKHASMFAERFGLFGGIGVSIGGPLNMRTGAVLSPPHLPSWDDVPLKAILEDTFSSCLASEAPVVVQHDAAACLCAEYLWGAARGASHAIYLTCGTGCGSGIMIDHQILMGPNGESPEIGYAQLADDGAPMNFCGMIRSGHTEGFGSGTGVALLAQKRFPDIFLSGTPLAVVAERAKAGDEAAMKVVRESATRMGQLCVTLAALFAPQVIVLGSLARYLEPLWTEHIQKVFAETSLPINSRNTKIIPSELANRLQDLSAIAPVVMKQRPFGGESTQRGC
jgi:glucokinase